MSKRTPPRQAAQKPGKADPHAGFLSQALTAHQRGQFADAERGYAFILTKNPAHFDALHYLGIVKMQLGQTEQGLALVEEALRIRPDSADALSNLSSGLIRAQRYAEALTYLDRSIALAPSQAETLTNRGIALAAVGRLEEALASHQHALKMRPDFPEAHTNHGNALRALGRFDDALAAYDKALFLRAAYPEALNNRGLALHELRLFEDAIASYDQALAQRANYPEALNNRGNAQKELRQFDAAFASYDEALRLRPDYAEARFNRGNSFGALNRHTEALAEYNAALALQPSHVDANWNKALSHLLLGQMQEGWAQYEWRWRLKSADPARSFDCPQWDGVESLAGKRIVLWAEQGLGDTLQFCRYAIVLASYGAHVVLDVQAPLASLLQSLHGVGDIVARGAPLPSADFHCPLLSLPRVLNANDIAGKPPYLAVPAEASARWAARIEALAPRVAGRKRIGISCSGNPKLSNDRNRSIALEIFKPLLAANADFFLMQKECREADAAFLRTQPQIHDLREELNDFVDTAAALAELDLLVSVDTSVAHLAGALNAPLWLLLPFAPDWRWQLDRADSPWYPSARLWRQPAMGDWKSVIADLARTLQAADRHLA